MTNPIDKGSQQALKQHPLYEIRIYKCSMCHPYKGLVPCTLTVPYYFDSGATVHTKCTSTGKEADWKHVGIIPVVV